MSHLLDVSEVTSGYGPVTVLRDVSLCVEAKEIVAILGSNGAGKSTLLKTIAGLLHPTAGTIGLDGTDISRRPPEAISCAGVVLVPEGRQLFAGMSVIDNLMLGAYGRRRDRAGNRETLKQVYALFPILEERAGQIAGSMSGGQQQMVAIGRGLMARPRVLLLDEPSLGLAPVVMRQVFDALAKLRELGMTVLIVEQNAKLTLELADRGYVLERGKFLLDGSSEELAADERVRNAYLGLGVGAAS